MFYQIHYIFTDHTPKFLVEFRCHAIRALVQMYMNKGILDFNLYHWTQQNNTLFIKNLTINAMDNFTPFYI